MPNIHALHLKNYFQSKHISIASKTWTKNKSNVLKIALAYDFSLTQVLFLYFSMSLKELLYTRKIY
jgi:hypothetical protein